MKTEPKQTIRNQKMAEIDRVIQDYGLNEKKKKN